MQPLQEGAGTKILAEKSIRKAAQRVKQNSFLWRIVESGFLQVNSGGYWPSEIAPALVIRVNNAKNAREAAVYSAAAANEGFTFADDTMKSEMRGTISDLKREPLKTP